MLTEYDRVIVISDLHITPQAHLGNFPEGMGEQLVQLTSNLASERCQRTALVLAGDIIDFLLVDNNRRSFEIAQFGSLMTTALQELKQNHEWFRRWAEELKKFGERGGQVILIPGNHDPEWFSKPAADAALKVLFGNSPCAWFQVHTVGDVWHAKVGSQHVKVLHGHTCDWWNDIDRAGLLQAIEDRQSEFPLPFGSQLVTGPLMAFKREQTNGKPRFPFIDRLKPEWPGVLLLLFALDPKLVTTSVPTLQTLPTALINSLNQRLFGRSISMLGPEPPTLDAQTTSADQAVTALAFELAQAFDAILTEADRKNKDRLIRQVQQYFEELKGLESSIVNDQSLGVANAIGRYLLRAWLTLERTRTAVENLFDPHGLSDVDQKIIRRYGEPLIPTTEKQVIVAGHTHTARLVNVRPGVTYCNTGTWTDVIQLGMTDLCSSQGVNETSFLLLSNTIPVKCAPTWAEIRSTGVKLRDN
jgi:UDP-2,3-diacylglucosamine pyrophosphatase LpxH